MMPSRSNNAGTTLQPYRELSFLSSSAILTVMDRFFDKLGNLLRSIIREEPEDNINQRDPDLKAAWEEIDEFLKTGYNRQRSRAKSRPVKNIPVPEVYKQDFINLEIHPTASLEEVKRSYKKLLRKYHPDRHADNPQKQQMATRITQKLNVSYQRIVQLKKNQPRNPYY